MKRYKSFLSIIMLLMIFGLTQGCDNNDKKEETPTPTEPTTPTTPTPAPSATIDLFLSDVTYCSYKALCFTVHNGGNTDANNVLVYYFDGHMQDLVYCIRYLLTVPAGGSVTRKIFPAGAFSYLIIIDPYYTIAETNELNNTACMGLYCTSPPSYSICPSVS